MFSAFSSGGMMLVLITLPLHSPLSSCVLVLIDDAAVSPLGRYSDAKGPEGGGDLCLLTLMNLYNTSIIRVCLFFSYTTIIPLSVCTILVMSGNWEPELSRLVCAHG